MKTTCSLRRAAALGFFILPVFCESAPQAIADAFYTVNTTVSTKVTGMAYIGAASATAATFTSPTVVFTSTASVTGGIVIDGGSLSLPTGCTVAKGVTVNTGGTFTMTGGTIGSMSYGINGSGTSIISVSGGTILGDLGSTGKTLTLSGGTVDGQLIADVSASVTFSGGSALSGLGVYSNATLNLTGAGLTVLSSSYSAPYTIYTVSGMLTNNSQTLPVTYNVLAQDGAHFQFNGHSVSSAASTPAPGSLSVALLGGAGVSIGLIRRRRR